jgi:hypothetical protein
MSGAADPITSFQVAARADIQTALPRVHEVFAAINRVPDLRVFVGMGDLTDRGQIEEYALYERQLEELALPFYPQLEAEDQERVVDVLRAAL